MNSEIVALLTLTVYVLTGLLLSVWQIRSNEGGWRTWLLYIIERLYLGFGYGVRTNRPCPFPNRGPGLIIANHSSPVDPLLLWMNNHLRDDPAANRVRVISFLTAREYCEVGGFVGWICRSMRSIPVNRDGRDMAPLKAAIGKLKEGALVGVFPEGRINPANDRLLPGNPGIAWLALRAQVPVYPVYIHNAPRGTTMVEPFYRFQPVRLTYGEPIDLSGYYDRKKSQDVLQEVTDLLMSRLAELGNVRTSPLPFLGSGEDERPDNATASANDEPRSTPSAQLSR